VDAKAVGKRQKQLTYVAVVKILYYIARAHQAANDQSTVCCNVLHPIASIWIKLESLYHGVMHTRYTCHMNDQQRFSIQKRWLTIILPFDG